jgi:molybdopterin synthase sulfur carrier subunit
MLSTCSDVRFALTARRIPTMAVTIRVPTTLRTLTAGESNVQVEPGTVGAVLGSLESAHPGFAERLLDGDGKLRRFVNVFVSDDDVRFMNGLDTDVPDGETVSIVPAVAGG